MEQEYGYRVYNRAGHYGEVMAQGFAQDQQTAKELAEKYMTAYHAEAACVSRKDGSDFLYLSMRHENKATEVRVPNEKRIMMDLLLCAEGQATRPKYADKIEERWEMEVEYVRRRIYYDARIDYGDIDIERLYRSLENAKDGIVCAFGGTI